MGQVQAKPASNFLSLAEREGGERKRGTRLGLAYAC